MYIFLYKGNPTKDIQDGSPVSQGDWTLPVEFPSLNIINAEISPPVKLAIRCQSKTHTVGVTTITPYGPSADKYRLSTDGLAWEPWGSGLTLASTITDVNTVFYAQARAIVTEGPQKDNSTSLRVNATLYGD